MQAKEKYPQHNVSNSKENLRVKIIQTALFLKKTLVNNHTTIISPTFYTALVLASNWRQDLL
jgi:hypothetical protein